MFSSGARAHGDAVREPACYRGTDVSGVQRHLDAGMAQGPNGLVVLEIAQHLADRRAGRDADTDVLLFGSRSAHAVQRVWSRVRQTGECRLASASPQCAHATSPSQRNRNRVRLRL